MNERQTRLAYLSLLIAAVIFPNVARSDYHLHLGVIVGLYVMLTSSLGLVMGYAGQFALGHAAFFGIGAYTSALLVRNHHWNSWLALPVALLLTGVFSAGIAYPSLRLRGAYFGIATFGFGELIRSVLDNWTPVTGGSQGISAGGRPSPIGIGSFALTFDTKYNYYYLVLAAAALTVFVMYRLVHSRAGRAFIAVREDEMLAQAIGVNIWRQKFTAVIAGSLFAGLAGVLYAHYILFIVPESFGIEESLKLVMILLIGGAGSIAGPIIGSAMLVVLPEVLAIPPTLYMIVYGLLLIAIILAMPRGIAGGFDREPLARLLRRLNPASRSGRGTAAGHAARVALEGPPEEAV